ncbi:cytochrome b pre-mRNA-processing protein 3 [Cohaesibacter sp. ES.047]|uniref:ubiquinol-cytochrome C chaperone family protein n=1 Tax=Cohaesibacter sp. ES.047 TaxID=1798205 RepID=UPI000BC09C6E|nr:ubiquinol-cytochrome C chaperone family protein [Cohaesibacter sp. ES.047]SNY93094.1 cytochrome b pre-mRNA-processing protein 3 [Cohaesibacter sp. ES.047]
MIFRLFRKETDREKAAAELYEAIVAQARQPEFYLDYGVEDSTNGRFEMIVLHAYMLLYRLRQEDSAAKTLGQAVFDRFFRDMDDSLRERGVGDLSVPKKIKKMAQHFYGRVEAYDAARADSEERLAEAIERNVFARSQDVTVESRKMANYVFASATELDGQSVEDFASGKIEFASLPDHNT